jgi:spermidine synthase
MPAQHRSARRAVRQEHARQWRRIALALFTASGVAGLTYEVIWSRQLTLIFGATTLAVSTVLTTYMFGLGLGSFLARWRTDRAGNPLRLYAILEAGIGIYAVMFPAVLWLVERLHGTVFGLLYAAPLPLPRARFVLAFLALLPPALLMGATVPVMGQALTARARDAGVRAGPGTGADAGRLYA